MPQVCFLEIVFVDLCDGTVTQQTAPFFKPTCGEKRNRPQYITSSHVFTDIYKTRQQLNFEPTVSHSQRGHFCPSSSEAASEFGPLKETYFPSRKLDSLIPSMRVHFIYRVAQNPGKQVLGILHPRFRSLSSFWCIHTWVKRSEQPTLAGWGSCADLIKNRGVLCCWCDLLKNDAICSNQKYRYFLQL